jgi:hypothetical protein
LRQRDGLLIGVVKEAEASASKRCSLIIIETGKDVSIGLLMKNNAGFLVGRLVLYDQGGKSVSWIENESYTFRVIARLKPRPARPASLAMQIECRECTSRIAAGEILDHLKRQHWFPRTIDLDRVPEQPASLVRDGSVGHSTKAKTAILQRICPYPSRWSDTYEELAEYAETHSCRPNLPPAPLILAGWVYTNDIDKMRRWRETVDWASANGCAGIVEGISDQDFYEVENPTSYSVGPMGGPCYRPWDTEGKVRPTNEELTKHLEYLSSHWADIAGSDLSTVTRPVAFTGKKARRLLARADATATPPWGGWTVRSQDEGKRRTFTRFRAAVNKAIAPHEVDHIEFTFEPEQGHESLPPEDFG